MPAAEQDRDKLAVDLARVLRSGEGLDSCVTDLLWDMYVWDKNGKVQFFEAILSLSPGFVASVFYSNSLFHRDSDGAKKNEPVIDWLDATVGRVHNTAH